MSGSTVSTRIRPGEATAQRLRERRAAMVAERERVRASVAPARVRELVAQGARASRELGGLVARRDAAARHADARELAAANRRLDRAVRDGCVPEAFEVVAQLERAADATWERQELQELALLQVLEHLPASLRPVKGSLRRGADGVLRVNTTLAAGGTVGLSLTPGGETLEFEVERSGVDRLVTARGTLTGCDAQHALVESVCEHLQRSGVDIAPPARADHAGPTSAVARRHAGADR